MRITRVLKSIFFCACLNPLLAQTADSLIIPVVTVVMNQTDGTYFETSFETYEALRKAVLPFIKLN